MPNISRDVLEILQEGVLLLAPSPGGFIITYANPAVGKFEDVPPKDLWGQPLLVVLPRFAAPEIADVLQQTLLTGEFHSFDAPCIRGSKTLWFQYVVSRIGKDSLVVSYSDSTLLKEHQQKAEAANKRLQNANAELERFAYVASHDLREPMNKIMAFGERIQRASLECPFRERTNNTCGKVDQYLTIMIRATRRSDTMIQDLLAYSRMGQDEKNPLEIVDVGAVLHDIRESLSVVMLEKGATIEIGVLPQIQAHRVPIQQLFLNLLANALKFTKPGRAPLIKVASRSLEDKGVVEITVSDNGIGFEPQYAEDIFGVFARLHSRFDYEGTGMGLALVRRIAQRYKGTVTAVGVPEEGASFIVCFPCIEA